MPLNPELKFPSVVVGVEPGAPFSSSQRELPSFSFEDITSFHAPERSKNVLSVTSVGDFVDALREHTTVLPVRVSDGIHTGSVPLIIWTGSRLSYHRDDVFLPETQTDTKLAIAIHKETRGLAATARDLVTTEKLIEFYRRDDVPGQKHNILPLEAKALALKAKLKVREAAVVANEARANSWQMVQFHDAAELQSDIEERLSRGEQIETGWYEARLRGLQNQHVGRRKKQKPSDIPAGSTPSVDRGKSSGFAAMISSAVHAQIPAKMRVALGGVAMAAGVFLPASDVIHPGALLASPPEIQGNEKLFEQYGKMRGEAEAVLRGADVPDPLVQDVLGKADALAGGDQTAIDAVQAAAREYREIHPEKLTEDAWDKAADFFGIDKATLQKTSALIGLPPVAGFLGYIAAQRLFRGVRPKSGSLQAALLVGSGPRKRVLESVIVGLMTASAACGGVSYINTEPGVPQEFHPFLSQEIALDSPDAGLSRIDARQYPEAAPLVDGLTAYMNDRPHLYSLDAAPAYYRHMDDGRDFNFDIVFTETKRDFAAGTINYLVAYRSTTSRAIVAVNEAVWNMREPRDDERGFLETFRLILPDGTKRLMIIEEDIINTSGESVTQFHVFDPSFPGRGPGIFLESSSGSEGGLLDAFIRLDAKAAYAAAPEVATPVPFEIPATPTPPPTIPPTEELPATATVPPTAEVTATSESIEFPISLNFMSPPSVEIMKEWGLTAQQQEVVKNCGWNTEKAQVVVKQFVEAKYDGDYGKFEAAFKAMQNPSFFVGANTQSTGTLYESSKPERVMYLGSNVCSIERWNLYNYGVVKPGTREVKIHYFVNNKGDILPMVGKIWLPEDYKFFAGRYARNILFDVDTKEEDLIGKQFNLAYAIRLNLETLDKELAVYNDAYHSAQIQLSIIPHSPGLNPSETDKLSLSDVVKQISLYSEAGPGPFVGYLQED